MMGPLAAISLATAACDEAPLELATVAAPSVPNLPSSVPPTKGADWANDHQLDGFVGQAREGADVYRSVTSVDQSGERLWWFRHDDGATTTLTLACERTRAPFEMAAQDHDRWLGVITYEGALGADGWVALRRQAMRLGKPPPRRDSRDAFVRKRDDLRDSQRLAGSFFSHPHSVCGLVPERMWFRCAPTRLPVRAAGAVAKLHQPAGREMKTTFDWEPPTTELRPLSVCRIEVEVATTSGELARRQANVARRSHDRRCSQALYFARPKDTFTYECIDHPQSALRFVP